MNKTILSICCFFVGMTSVIAYTKEPFNITASNYPGLCSSNPHGSCWGFVKHQPKEDASFPINQSLTKENNECVTTLEIDLPNIKYEYEILEIKWARWSNFSSIKCCICKKAWGNIGGKGKSGEAYAKFHEEEHEKEIKNWNEKNANNTPGGKVNSEFSRLRVIVKDSDYSVSYNNAMAAMQEKIQLKILIINDDYKQKAGVAVDNKYPWPGRSPIGWCCPCSPGSSLPEDVQHETDDCNCMS